MVSWASLTPATPFFYKGTISERPSVTASAPRARVIHLTQQKNKTRLLVFNEIKTTGLLTPPRRQKTGYFRQSMPFSHT